MFGISPDGPISRFARRLARDSQRSHRRQEQQVRLESALKESRSGRFLWVGSILIFLAWAIYLLKFVPSFQASWVPSLLIPLNEKTMAAWGQFGDFLGGVLNPLLSFLALLAVVKNLRLQSEQMAQSQDDRFASEIANRMSALSSASAVLTASIEQDLEVTSKGGPVNSERYHAKLNQREDITRELLRLAQQLLDDE